MATRSLALLVLCLVVVNALTANPNIPDKLPLDQFFSFKTRPDILAPRWEIQYYNREQVSPGYWFTAVYENLNSKTSTKRYIGPTIYDDHGHLVWSAAGMFDHADVFDIRVSQLAGGPAISLIDLHSGSAFILNEHYEVFQEFKMGKFGFTMNMHEFNLVENGSKLLTLHRNLTYASAEQAGTVSFDGNCSIANHFMRESEMTSNTTETLFEWHMIDHIPLSESTATYNVNDTVCEHNWDWLHANSVDKCPDGDLLLSIRHTDALYKISHDGSIVWRFGGKTSDFSHDFEFSRQHHATCLQSNNTHVVISFLDNAEGDEIPSRPSHTYSRGLLVSLSLESMQAIIMAEYPHPEKRLQNARGSCQVLLDGNVLMGWSNRSLLSEHAANGDLLMSAKTVPNWIRTYRTYKFPFIGRPRSRPDVFSEVSLGADDASSSSDNHDGSETGFLTKVFVSWNGATEVAYWKFYLSDGAGNIRKLISTVDRQNFETNFTYNGLASYVVVEAVDRNEDPIENGLSRVIKTHLPDAVGGGRPGSPASVALESAKFNERKHLTDEQIYGENGWHPQMAWYTSTSTPLAMVMLVLGVVFGIGFSRALLNIARWSPKRIMAGSSALIRSKLPRSFWTALTWPMSRDGRWQRHLEGRYPVNDEASHQLIAR